MAERNLKTTLLELLQQRHLLTVGEILDTLDREGKSYNKTSVYRALDQLLAEGEVCRHYFTEAQAAYELRSHHHAHLVCEHCGQITVGECLYQQPQTVGTFKVNHHHLTLMGLCAKCQTELAK